MIVNVDGSMLFHIVAKYISFVINTYVSHIRQIQSKFNEDHSTVLNNLIVIPTFFNSHIQFFLSGVPKSISTVYKL